MLRRLFLLSAITVCLSSCAPYTVIPSKPAIGCEHVPLDKVLPGIWGDIPQTSSRNEQYRKDQQLVPGQRVTDFSLKIWMEKRCRYPMFYVKMTRYSSTFGHLGVSHASKTSQNIKNYEIPTDRKDSKLSQFRLTESGKIGNTAQPSTNSHRLTLASLNTGTEKSQLFTVFTSFPKVI